MNFFDTAKEIAASDIVDIADTAATPFAKNLVAGNKTTVSIDAEGVTTITCSDNAMLAKLKTYAGKHEDTCKIFAVLAPFNGAVLAYRFESSVPVFSVKK